MRWIAATFVVALTAAASAATSGLPGDDAAVEHALSRLTFGARPGQVARVQAVGLDHWIDEQLHPERLTDEALDRRLTLLLTLESDAAAARPADREAARVQARERIDELSQAKILRAVYSERQLEEVLVDFWFNHFNVFAGKLLVRGAVTSYERDAIRPHVFGRFRDLLGATAKSPAMLGYLDNWQNVDPKSAERLRSQTRATARPRLRQASGSGDAEPRPAPPPRGLNENYARELLELHTLGVDGGYTQQDVVEVARAFTGWTMRPRRTMTFEFAALLHDRGAKTVLGHTIPAGGGAEDGERVLDLLAAHPSTARHIATKLARRFVSDEPPPALVDRVAARFTATGGDLRETVRAVVTSPEFFAHEARAAKLKTPLEFVASALRASGADLRHARAVVRTLRDLGMAPYFCQPPTGYADDAATWTTSGALVSRMNFALALRDGTLRGVTVPGAAPESLTTPVFQQR